jgi:hypothetical protein
VVDFQSHADDPGIFPTTLQNEFRLIKNTAIKEHGCCEFEAEQRLEGIRRFGLEIFESNHLQAINCR